MNFRNIRSFLHILDDQNKTRNPIIDELVHSEWNNVDDNVLEAICHGIFWSLEELVGRRWNVKVVER